MLSEASGKTSITTSNLPSNCFEMEEALIECHELWRRSPGEASWPFAGDGPWHLIQPEVGDVAGEQSTTLIESKSGQQLEVRKLDSRAPRAPLRSREVDRRDQVTAWLQLVPDQIDRKCLWLATHALFRGEGRIPWSALCAWLRFDRTSRALAWRYRKALAELVCRVNGWPMRRSKAMAQAYSAPSRED